MSSHPLTDIDFESFNLHPTMLSGLHAAGFIRCTPIQALTLPVALAGRDVAGQAQTGTGKTAAFLVAVLNRLLTQPAIADRKLTDPRAVILAPTRELAIQIDKDFRNIGRDTGLRSALIYGGVDYEKQREMLRAGCDIIIATPGRLIDYLKQHVFSFRGIEALVIDEADRMFDLGFIKDIRFLLRRMPPREERQSMLFSATLSHRVLELAYEHMNSPEKLTVETESVTASRVRQVVYFPAKEEKLPLLIGLLSRTDAQRSIVFVNTKIAAEKVTRSLEHQGHTVATLSGDVPQAKRERLLAKFQRGEIELLVATDVAARGLHIPDVSHVFNYDLPHDAEDYVHRIGRTARLGAEGDAISFACDLYAMALPDIESYIEQKIPVERIEPDILIAPPRRAGAKAVAIDEDTSADDARNTAGAPPQKTASRSTKPRSGGREDRGPRSDRGPRQRSDAPRSARPPRHDGPAPLASMDAAGDANLAADASASDTASNGASPIVSNGTQPATGDAPKKRRRRGGRGRNRRNGEDATNAGTGAQAGTSSERPPRSDRQDRGPRGDRPPRSEHVRAERAHGDRAPRGDRGARQESSTSAAMPIAQPQKGGFFQRIARFFTSR